MREYSRRRGAVLAFVAMVLLLAVPGCVPSEGLDVLVRTVVTPQTWFVALTGDDGNDCLAFATPCRTIGVAIERASAGDAIFVEPGTYQEDYTRSDGAFLIDKSIRLLGDGADAAAVRLDGDGLRPVLVVTGRAHPVLENLTIQNGGGGNGGGVLLLENAGLTVYRTVIQDNDGAGVFFTGGVGATLQLDEVVVRRNGNGGLQLGPGSTTIELSRIVRNTGPGIAILGGGFLTLRDSTVDRNQFDSNGEGLWVGEGSTVRVERSTFSRHDHVAIFNDGDLTLENTTVSANRVGIRNWRDLSLISSTVAYNLGLSLDDQYARRVYVKDSIVLKASASDCLLGSGTEVVLEGSSLTCWSASDGDLLLAPLADHGGPTQTLALLEGSPAIDAVVGDCGVAVDQRNVDRPQLVACDIGAFELRPDELGAEPLSLPAATLTPTEGAPPEPATPTVQTPLMGELRQNGNCRRGPGTAFGVVTSLLQGQEVQVDGQNAGEPKWWWILLPQSTAHCWVSAAIVEASEVSVALPVVAGPPPPAPTAVIQGCMHQGPNDNQPKCYAVCPVANPNPGGACTP